MRGTGRGTRAAVSAVLGALAAAATPAGAQTMDILPSPGAPAAAAAPSPADAPWSVESVEAPAEIAFGTMAVRIWARVRPADGVRPGWGVTLVLREDGEETRLPMEALDGAFDDPAEDVVATVDTYAWIREGEHAWELWSAALGAAPAKLHEGVVRVVPRLRTPDLVVLDEFGRATPWIGSGAGGFVPGPAVDCGIALGAPRVVDGDVLVSLQDGGVQVFKPERSGALAALRSFGCGAGMAAAAFGDLDGDGGTDLVTAHSPRFLEIRRDLDEVPTADCDLPMEAERVALADLDGDGREEIYLCLLGMAQEEIVRWEENDGEWQAGPALSPPPGGRGRIRGLVPLTGPGGKAKGLLCLSVLDGEGVLESWGGPADTESVDHPDAPRAWRVAGEPLGAVSGRFSDQKALSWVVWIRGGNGIEWLEIPRAGPERSRGRMDAEPAAVCALDLDGDGDDDLATGGGELRLWINVRGRDFREAGDSPYPLEARVVALAAGRLDE